MPMNNYNNNKDNRPTCTTFTPIAFSNVDSGLAQTRISISYFNYVMKIDISVKTSGSGVSFPKFDNDNAVVIYLSYYRAKAFHDGILEVLNNPDKHSVGVECRQGIIKFYDGTELGVNTPCFSILPFDDKHNITGEIFYQTKQDTAQVVYNMENGDTNSGVIESFPTFEVDTILMALEQYYINSSYAVAASVKESNMYMNSGRKTTLKLICDALNIKQSNNTSSGGYSGGVTYDYQRKPTNNQYNRPTNDTKFESTTIDEIIDSMNQ